VDQDIEIVTVDANVDGTRSNSQQQQQLNEDESVYVLSEPQGRSGSEGDMDLDLEKQETALNRIRTQQSQYAHTVGARQRSRQSTSSLPPMGAGKPYPPDLPGQEEYLVEFDGADDRIHPQNWSMSIKLVPANPVE